MTGIVVYTRSDCKWCYKIKGLLAELGILFEERYLPVNKQAEFGKAHKVYTLPQVFIDEKRIGGYEEFKTFARERILYGHEVSAIQDTETVLTA